MPAPPSPISATIPAKKFKSDTLTYTTLNDGRIVINTVKKGVMPKEVVPGLLVKSIMAENATEDADVDADAIVEEISSSTQADQQRKAAIESGAKTIKIVLGGDSSVVATGQKPSKDSKVGLSLRREPEHGIVVRKIEPDSIFAKSGLRVGQIVTRVGKVACPKETKDVIALLKSAKKGPLTLVAVDPASPPVAATREEDEEEPVPPKMEAAPPMMAPNDHKDQPVTPDASEADDDDDDDEDAAPPAPVVKNEQPPVMQPSDSQDDDDDAGGKDDFDDQYSTDGGKGHEESKNMTKDDRATGANDDDDSTPAEEKKTDEAGSNWLCCAY